MVGRKKVSTRFTLQGLNFQDTILLYYADGYDEDQDVKQTSISMPKKRVHAVASKNCVYFLDPHKHKIKLWCNMFDIAQFGPLPIHTTKPCWNCRHTFSTYPIGCPIRYVKTSMLSPILFSQIKEWLKSMNLPEDIGDIFETEGIFCSFPCALRYIISQGKVALYKKSATLLALMYSRFTGQISDIPKAASWKVLKPYGGHLTIEEYRESFGKFSYVETPNIRKPMMYSTARYIQER